MVYDIKIDGLSAFPGYGNISTQDAGVLAKYRKQACEKAREAVPQWKADRDGEHLVYYYEWKGKEPDTTKAVVLMKPRAVSDADFQTFVEDFKPDYVGAIHRRL